MTDRELLYTGLKEFLPEVSEKMIDDLLKFSALLLEKNKVMNLTAVTEPTEVVTRHFLDCAALAPHMPQGGRVLDVGTGAGFPGMPLAILCPETEFVLLDALRKRIDFLNEVIETLGLTNVTAVHARAEDFAKDSRASFDMAVSRAVADLRTLSELAVPMVKVGGCFLAMKAADCAEEVQSAAHAFEVLGVGEPEMLSYTVPHDGIERALVRLPKISDTPDNRSALKLYGKFTLCTEITEGIFCPKISISAAFSLEMTGICRTRQITRSILLACLQNCGNLLPKDDRATENRGAVPLFIGHSRKRRLLMMKSVLTLVSGREDRVLRRIRISEIVRNPNQPRRYFDPEAIATLAESIRQYGVLNPLTVRRTGNGGYELVAGERRLRAARVAGLTDVPCLLINADGEDSSVIALVENLQRRDLDFFEEANGFKRLIEQFGLTQEEAARKVGKTQSAVANKLRLLRLSQQNMELIRCNNLTERHARALLRLNDEADRINVTNYIIEHELNVSRTEEYIDEFLKAKENPQPVVEAESGKRVVRLFKDVRFFLNTLNRAVGVMVDAGIGATVKQQESDDGLTLTICIPHAKG